jgi:ubiquinone/menaquinone biosynthesis C-methylase UbiE
MVYDPSPEIGPSPVLSPIISDHPTESSSQAPPDKTPETCVGSAVGAERQRLVDAHFQAHAAEWRDIYTEASSEGAIYRERSATVLKWADELLIPRADRILDIGCGAGLITVALARRGHLVEAVDSIAEMLKATRRYAHDAGMGSSILTSLGDAHRLAFADNAFGLVLAIGVLPWLHSPQQALAEMARVLKPGGFLLLTVGNRSRLTHILDPWVWPALQPVKKVVRALLARFRTRSEAARPSLRLDSLPEAARWLSSVGLVKVKVKTVGFPPLTFCNRPMFDGRASIAWNLWLQRLADHNVPGIRSMGMDYLVLARKRAR